MTGDATGNFNVFVANTGVSPKTGDPLMLVTTGAEMPLLRWGIPGD